MPIQANKALNERVWQELTTIADQQGVTIDDYHFHRVMGWEIERLKKIWVTGKIENLGKTIPVVLKIRPSGSVIASADFVRTELAGGEINQFLADNSFPASRTIKQNLNNPPEWIIREYLPGDVIGPLDIEIAIDNRKFISTLQQMRQLLDRAYREINLSVIPRPDWQAMWLKELDQFSTAVKSELGQEALNTLETILSGHYSFKSLSLVHSDLAPQNIVVTNGDYLIIDWGEVAVGPRAVDWMTVWSFAVFQPELQKELVKQMLRNCQSVEELAETKLAGLAIAARLMLKFAENAKYFADNPKEPSRLIHRSRAILEQSWKNFQLLQKILND
jgi:hypothetical protein